MLIRDSSTARTVSSVHGPLQRLGGAALVALALVAAAVAVSQSSGGATAPQRPARTATDVLRGIAQDGDALGDPRAPVTLTEFADLQCPFCRQYAETVLPALIDRYVRAGRLRLVFRPLAFIGPDSQRAARFAGAAGLQDRLWQAVGVLYLRQGGENTGYVTDAFLRDVARGAGVDARRALAQESDAAVAAQLAAAEREAQRFGVDSTPAFLLRRSDGRVERLVPRALTLDAFAGPIDAALRGT